MIKTGVDIVDIYRIKNILKNRREEFYNRLFTEREISYIKDKKHSPKTVAAIFAGKEAVSKALGTGIGQVGWKDLEILHDENGKPYVVLSKKAAGLSKKLRIDTFDISISHEERYAIAFVIGYDSYRNNH